MKDFTFYIFYKRSSNNFFFNHKLIDLSSILYDIHVINGWRKKTSYIKPPLLNHISNLYFFTMKRQIYVDVLYIVEKTSLIEVNNHYLNLFDIFTFKNYKPVFIKALFLQYTHLESHHNVIFYNFCFYHIRQYFCTFIPLSKCCAVHM